MFLGSGRQTYPDDHAFAARRNQPYFTLELTYSGTMLRQSGADRHFRPQPNHTLLLTPPGMHYALCGQRSGEEIWLLFNPRQALLGCLDWPQGDFGIPQLPVGRTPIGRQILQAFEDAHAYMSGRLPRREMQAENALEHLLLLAEQLSTEIQAPADERVGLALDIIHARFDSPLSVAQLAEQVCLSPSRFAHLFRQQTGTTPMGYLEDVRLERAQLLLLRTDLQIKEIARRVGFADAYYFSTRFRRRLGRPPTAWRNAPAPLTRRKRPTDRSAATTEFVQADRRCRSNLSRRQR